MDYILVTLTLKNWELMFILIELLLEIVNLFVYIAAQLGFGSKEIEAGLLKPAFLLF